MSKKKNDWEQDDPYKDASHEEDALESGSLAEESDGDLQDGKDSWDIHLPQKEPISWKLLRIEDVVLHISTEGKVKRYQDTTPAFHGFCAVGTPFRVYPLTHTQVYMHELVWWAFCGRPPPGWRVCHKSPPNFSNVLSNLTIAPYQVSSLEDMLP